MKNRLFFIPAFVVILIFLILGSIFDLNIAQMLYHADNGFSHFMAGFTTAPISFVLGFMCGTLLKMVVKHKYQQRWQNIVLVIISVGLAISGCYFFGQHFTSYHAYNLNPAFNILFGLIFLIPGYICGYHFYEKIKSEHLLITYLFIFLVVVFIVVLVEIIKICLPRLRYTSVVILGDEYYHPWYLTDFSLNKEFIKEHHLIDNEEIKSFPSGHSSYALTNSFVLMFIPILFPRFKNKEVYFFYGGFLFFLLVAFSRILIGAHYLSDTMFAGLLALLVFFIANEVYLRKLI